MIMPLIHRKKHSMATSIKLGCYPQVHVSTSDSWTNADGGRTADRRPGKRSRRWRRGIRAITAVESLAINRLFRF